MSERQDDEIIWEDASITAARVIEKSVEIAAPPRDVWRALTEPELMARWMLGTRVESIWEPGAEIIFANEIHGRAYRDRGTVLAIEPGRLLRYSHWAEFSALSDVPEHRTLVTLELEWMGEKTRLSVRHEHFSSYEAYGHGNFFWGYALRDIQNIVEG